MSNIQDTATLNEIRRLHARIARLESQLSRVVKNTTGLLNHSELNELDYASAGHTGFASDADLTTLEGTVTTHVADTANPHSTTLEQAISADANASSTPSFNGGIEAGGATLGLGLPGDIQGTNTSGSLILNSDTTSFPSVPRPSYQFLGYADTFAKFLDRNTLSAILEFQNDGNIIKQNDPADRFLHEKMTLPVLTGTWTFSGTAKGTNLIHVGSTSPSGGERLWVDTLNNQLRVDILGGGSWQFVVGV